MLICTNCCPVGVVPIHIGPVDRSFGQMISYFGRVRMGYV
jgi:hypothetical protein